MVVRLTESIPFVLQTILKFTFKGQWPAEKISDNIANLIRIGLCVQGIVTDNISYKIELQTIS